MNPIVTLDATMTTTGNMTDHPDTPPCCNAQTIVLVPIITFAAALMYAFAPFNGPRPLQWTSDVIHSTRRGYIWRVAFIIIGREQDDEYRPPVPERPVVLPPIFFVGGNDGYDYSHTAFSIGLS